MKTLISRILIISIIGLFGFSGILKAQDEMSSNTVKIIAVKFYSDNCKLCKKMKAALMQAEKDLKDESVKFIKFDFTSDESIEASKSIAESYDLLDVYNANFEKTGFVILYDAESLREIGRITADMDAEKMKRKVMNNLMSDE